MCTSDIHNKLFVYVYVYRIGYAYLLLDYNDNDVYACPCTNIITSAS